MSQPLEHELVPYEAVKRLGGGPALVFAPHADDETLGCGGAIMRHLEAGDSLEVVIVTDGAYRQEADIEAYRRTRRGEARSAATILGYGEPIFWDLPDRGLAYDEALIERIGERIAHGGAQLVYAPSWWEVHPDHVTLALCVTEAVRRVTPPPTLALYEVGAPLQPNRLLDITRLQEQKQAAIRCFTSQLAVQRYDEHIAALNRYRTYTLPAEVEFAEAYHVVSGAGLLDAAGPDRCRKLVGLQQSLLTQIQSITASLSVQTALAQSALDLAKALDRNRRASTGEAASQKLQEEVQTLRQAMTEIQLSTSWRITAPLRALFARWR